MAAPRRRGLAERPLGEENIVMKITRKSFLQLLGLSALTLGGVGCGAGSTASSSAVLSPSDPVTLTVWTYYNGDQLETFHKLVEEFNNTLGQEKGILVETSSLGGVTELENAVLESAEGKVGAPPLPSIFSAYADTAYAIDQMGLLADLSGFFPDEERAAYIEDYLSEGDFDGSGSIKIFPTAKSTELLFLNDTDWQLFAAASGCTYEDLATMESLVSTAEKYYQWTEEQTGEGKALFGRDAPANYMLVGAQQLGCTLFEVKDGRMTLHFPEEVARTLWDNYYVPFIRGWFAATGRFRSDDIKTGNILAYVGSTSSASFFPNQVTTDDSEGHAITMKVLPCPGFADSEPYAVQQGAGMVVTRGSDEEISASVEFLKWFTDPEHNLAFSIASGYLPVTKEATDMEQIEKSEPALNDTMKQILTDAVTTVNTSRLYTTPAFSGANDARSVLEYSLSDAASADRAVIEDRLSAGQPFEEAAADFLTDARFDSWYEATLTKLEAFQG